jgi:hypothetical protein
MNTDILREIINFIGTCPCCQCNKFQVKHDISAKKGLAHMIFAQDVIGQ